MTRQTDMATIFRAEDLDHQQLRVLILINAVAQTPGTAKKLDGLTKLAKLDFLARYREFENVIALELDLVDDRSIDGDEAGMTATPMTRFRYGPWDDQYYPAIGALVGRGLIRYTRGKQGSVGLSLTPRGVSLVKTLQANALWEPVIARYGAIAERFGTFTGNKLKEAIYAALPEQMNVRFGTELT